MIALSRLRRGDLSRRSPAGAKADVVLVALAGAHAAALMAAPTAPLIAIGLWWNANTISHDFIHRPFFRHRSANHLFAAFLSVLLGFPHALWRDRHLAHRIPGERQGAVLDSVLGVSRDRRRDRRLRIGDMPCPAR